MSDLVESQLLEAALNGRTPEVSSLLRDDPDINVNLAESDPWAPLHFASFQSHVEVIKLLLAHPSINVNLKNDDGETPFPLVVGVTKKGKWRSKGCTALEIARKNQCSEVVSVLERFTANPALTRHEVRVKLGLLDALASEIFALAVFLCDDFLQLRAAPLASAITTSAATRLFVIAQKLPMELQMILCHRALGSMKQNILHKDSETAFKDLARILLLLPSQSK